MAMFLEECIRVIYSSIKLDPFFFEALRIDKFRSNRII